jgi:hypothetical protein
MALKGFAKEMGMLFVDPKYFYTDESSERFGALESC